MRNLKQLDWRKSATLVLAATAIAATAGTAFALKDQRRDLSGTPVPQLPSADRISRWQPLDASRLLVEVTDHEQYVLKVPAACGVFNLAANFGAEMSVSMSDNTIWAGFDRVTVDGRACVIEAINRL